MAAWIYFAFSALLALLALSAVGRPLRGPLSIAQFFLGWLPCELPLFFLAPAVLLFAGGLALGAADHPAGFAALALDLFAIVALAVCHRRTGSAAATVEAALRDALGADYAQHILPERAALLRRTIPAALLWRTFALREPAVEVVRDLSYGSHGERNLLDLYLPAQPRTRCPVLLWVHGGAWVMGHKAQQGMPLLHHFARSGWICVAINYRLGPAARFPAPLTDIKRALQWIRETIADHGGDPGFIVSCGNSAGGHLATLAALTAGRRELQDDFGDADTSVAALVSLYGRYDFLNRTGVADIGKFLETRVMSGPATGDRAAWEAASPLSQVHAGAPPMFALHGTHDALVPVEEARDFIAAMRAVAAAPVAYAELHGAQHAFEQFHTPRGEPAIDAVHRFFEFHYSAYRRRIAGG